MTRNKEWTYSLSRALYKGVLHVVKPFGFRFNLASINLVVLRDFLREVWTKAALSQHEKFCFVCGSSHVAVLFS